MGARAGAWIVEIGYSDEGNPLPSDYFCQARNLGLRYWLSMADQGSYGSSIVANVQDILDTKSKQSWEQGAKQSSRPQDLASSAGVTYISKLTTK